MKRFASRRHIRNVRNCKLSIGSISEDGQIIEALNLLSDYKVLKKSTEVLICIPIEMLDDFSQ